MCNFCRVKQDFSFEHDPILPLSLAVDRSISSSLSDARDALVNAVIDSLSTFRTAVLSQQQQQQPGVIAPLSLRLFPLYVLALLKQVRNIFFFQLLISPFIRYQNLLKQHFYAGCKSYLKPDVYVKSLFCLYCIVSLVCYEKMF